MIDLELVRRPMMQSFRTRILALVLGLVTVTVVATVGAVVIKAREAVGSAPPSNCARAPRSRARCCISAARN